MSVRAWLYIAALGLTLAPSGQAQDQAGSGQEGADAQEGKAEPLPFAIPVQIIEDDETTQSRERREREGRQREIEDLAAQQGMNKATRAMNDATQDMALYSLISTIAIIVGTGLLIWTLALTRQANRAAQAAVKEGEKATAAAQEAVAVSKAANSVNQRPWLHISQPELTEVRVWPSLPERSTNSLFIEGRVPFTNTGKTPALSVLAICEVVEQWSEQLRQLAAETEAWPSKPDVGGFISIAPGQTYHHPFSCSFDFEVPPDRNSTGLMLCLFTAAGYRTLADDKRKVTTAIYFISQDQDARRASMMGSCVDGPGCARSFVQGWDRRHAVVCQASGCGCS